MPTSPTEPRSPNTTNIAEDAQAARLDAVRRHIERNDTAAVYRMLDEELRMLRAMTVVAASSIADPALQVLRAGASVARVVLREHLAPSGKKTKRIVAVLNPILRSARLDWDLVPIKRSRFRCRVWLLTIVEQALERDYARATRADHRNWVGVLEQELVTFGIPACRKHIASRLIADWLAQSRQLTRERNIATEVILRGFVGPSVFALDVRALDSAVDACAKQLTRTVLDDPERTARVFLRAAGASVSQRANAFKGLDMSAARKASE